MSFLKITDPAKRDFIVEKFFESKNNIQRDFMSEKLGDIGLQRELRKAYKPIIDSQSEMSTGLRGELSAIKESSTSTANALKALPSTLKAIQFPQYPSIEAYDDPISDIRTLELGDLATKYLHQYASNKKFTDTTFGINSKNGIFYIGDSPISIQGDDITVRDRVYSGTPGLWELLTMVKPNDSIYDNNDLEEYAEILDLTNAMRQPNNPSKPKSSRGEKYKNIVKPIWDRKVSKVGKGVVTLLPQDTDELVNMLHLRVNSFKAGNTGVRNEIVSICDELLRQGAIDKEYYKKINKVIIKNAGR